MSRQEHDVRSLSWEAAHRKAHAARSRRERRPAGAEAPRDVFLAACAEIAKAFRSEGFTYAKSGPHLRRRRREWTDHVHFQSDYNNVAGEFAALVVHATLGSKVIRRWQIEQRSPLSEWRAGGQIGNLTSSPRWIKWNLADPLTRIETIADVTSTIRALAIPYFAAFDDLGGLVARLSAGEFPGLWPGHAVELLLWVNEPEIALEHGRAVLDGLGIRGRYRLTRLRHKAEGFPQWDALDYDDQLARCSLRYGLRF